MCKRLANFGSGGFVFFQAACAPYMYIFTQTMIVAKRANIFFAIVPFLLFTGNVKGEAEEGGASLAVKSNLCWTAALRPTIEIPIQVLIIFIILSVLTIQI